VSTSDARCAECGAAWLDGVTCLDCFHALLAYENERPPAFGAVHHLTVACFYLQHPTGYAAAALEMWQALLADALDTGTKPAEFLRRASAKFEGATKARDSRAGIPEGWPSAWTVTVRDVLLPDGSPAIPEYIERAMEWARATRTTLSETTRALPRR
jgi:hypothetical protein